MTKTRIINDKCDVIIEFGDFFSVAQVLLYPFYGCINGVNLKVFPCPDISYFCEICSELQSRCQSFSSNVEEWKNMYEKQQTEILSLKKISKKRQCLTKKLCSDLKTEKILNECLKSKVTQDKKNRQELLEEKNIFNSRIRALHNQKRQLHKELESLQSKYETVTRNLRISEDRVKTLTQVKFKLSDRLANLKKTLVDQECKKLLDDILSKF
jgi:hypothetical protein